MDERARIDGAYLAVAVAGMLINGLGALFLGVRSMTPQKTHLSPVCSTHLWALISAQNGNFTSVVPAPYLRDTFHSVR